MKRDAKVGLAVVLVVCVSLAVVFGRQLATGPAGNQPTIADAGRELDVIGDLGPGEPVTAAANDAPIETMEPIDAGALDEPVVYTEPKPVAPPTVSTAAVEEPVDAPAEATPEPPAEPAAAAPADPVPPTTDDLPEFDEAGTAPTDEDFLVERERATFTGTEETAIVEGPAAAEPAPPAAPATRPASSDYAVAPGDSLWKIAKRFYGKGDDWDKIAKANGLDAHSALRVGMKLTIPGVKAAALAPPAPRAEVAPAPAGTQEYTVKSGDSFWKIASRMLGKGSRHGEIAKLNPGVSSASLRVGQKIIIPEK